VFSESNVGQSAFLGQRACRFAQEKEVQLEGGTKDGLTEGECRAWRADGDGRCR